MFFKGIPNIRLSLHQNTSTNQSSTPSKYLLIVIYDRTTFVHTYSTYVQCVLDEEVRVIELGEVCDG